MGKMRRWEESISGDFNRQRVYRGAPPPPEPDFLYLDSSLDMEDANNEALREYAEAMASMYG